MEHALDVLNSEHFPGNNQTNGTGIDDMQENEVNNTKDFITFVEEIKCLRDMLVLGGDAIRKDPSNLALQVSLLLIVRVFTISTVLVFPI